MTRMLRHVVLCVVMCVITSASLQMPSTFHYTSYTTEMNHNISYTPGTLNVDSTEIPEPELSMICRYWDGYLDYQTYQLLTCGHCYGYQFPHADLKSYQTILFSLNSTVFPDMTILIPDIRNESWVAKICSTLSYSMDCDLWKQCCTAAEQCCETQNSEVPGNVPEQLTCPSTWDGFACWGRSSAGETVDQACPDYIPEAMPERDAFKTCTENGTWFELTNKEWTDYTTCYTFTTYQITIFVKIGCSIISLLVLIPSVAIFLSYRVLRNQNRIRIHIHLFSSFILTCVMIIVWEGVYVYDRLSGTHGDNRIHNNSVACRLTYMLTRYAVSCNYFWLFCEGLYLHRLMVKAFQPPKKLYLFYILGWGFPIIPSVAYAVIRLYTDNTKCWIHHIQHFEWILFVPNILALFINLVFMCDILRILLTQLQSHPNEPSNYRRAIKATFVLIPLFGLQLVFIMYRPSHLTTAGQVYQILASALSNLQGFVVSIIFCLLNKEVMANLRRSCRRMGLCKTRLDGNRTHYTTYTVTSDVYTRDSPMSSSGTLDRSHEHIPLKTMEHNGRACVDD